MSVCYWGITGYGVDLDHVDKYIDREKVNLKIREINPNELFEEDVYEDDTFYGGIYSCFCEFLCELDDTHTLTWMDGGNSEKYYFLYEPQYPWRMRPNEPQSFEDVAERIYNAMKDILKDNISFNEIAEKVNYIDDYGCG